MDEESEVGPSRFWKSYWLEKYITAITGEGITQSLQQAEELRQSILKKGFDGNLI